ncbi:response regulator transcription factor [Ferrovibrio sp.]|uniref:response regulator transcription factor n=1 Tax=Ferrovibrio sp. TaxID=1917215 RepID=UPI003D0BD48C
MNRILVVEDEPALRRDLVEYLSLLGHASKGVASRRELIEALDAEIPDIVILDVGLPDGSGFDSARDIRIRCDCGVIMLTALSESDDRIAGFDSGADIYLVKPASLPEIRASVQSLLRRLANAGKLAPGENGVWRLNAVDWYLTTPNGKMIKLTATELSFLTALFERVGQPCSRDWLVQAIIRPQAVADARNLDTVVNRLRRKIRQATEAEPPIKMIYGQGYIFSASCRVDR